MKSKSLSSQDPSMDAIAGPMPGPVPTQEKRCVSDQRIGEERRGEGEGEALGPCGSIFKKCGVGLVFGSRNQFLTDKDW
jgi:hypothetical protein